MRAGLAVSVIGHVGAVMMTLLAWEARSTIAPMGSSVVPVEIVDIGPESNVRALARDVPDEEIETSAEAQPNQVQPETGATSSRTRQQRLTPEEEQQQFLAGLGNLGGQPRPRPTQGETAPTDRPGAGRGTAEQVALEDRAVTLVQNATSRCWRTTADMPNPERLIVVLEVQLDRNGGLVGQPRRIQPAGVLTFDSEMQEAVRRAEQAVRLCDPYSRVAEDPIVGQYYDVWRLVQIRFGPRQQ